MKEVLYSPMLGQVVTLDQVHDEMFSKKLLGDGVAVMPKEQKIYSPLDGVITMVYETKHAIGIRSVNGVEVLLHMGIDTAMLKGRPFDTKIKVGDPVVRGELLTIVDWEYIKRKGYDTIFPIIAINRSIEPLKTAGEIITGEPLFTIEY